NPFSYQPWLDLKTYAAMFETLKADILVFQELKIQKRDLRDDMVLVPGWDCYFTFPKHKKGYSGVAIYTRQSKIRPIRAEEGITGILTPPNSTTSYLNLPSDEQIGGYPYISKDDATQLDSEGRAVVLDIGAFVLIGTYSPANRDSSRDEFRHEFVRALLQRCRNLVAMGRRVVLTGDLNIARDEIDSAHAKDTMKQLGLKDFKDTPIRQRFHKFLKPHVEGVMVDLCREFWPNRRGMYTCWEQRLQARPGNYGARIDYVLCSENMRDWFSEANIQEGLMGSDHCPVYAILKPRVTLHPENDQGEDKVVATLDILNPQGIYVNGIWHSESASAKAYQQPKLSGRLLPEFSARRSIKDMFSKKPNVGNVAAARAAPGGSGSVTPATLSSSSRTTPSAKAARKGGAAGGKRAAAGAGASSASKRQKGTSAVFSSSAGGLAKSDVHQSQTRLSGFFKPASTGSTLRATTPAISGEQQSKQSNASSNSTTTTTTTTAGTTVTHAIVHDAHVERDQSSGTLPTINGREGGPIKEVIEAKDAWGLMFRKKEPPRCVGHGEPCKMLTTKKPGANFGRSFWTCARPIGPDGEQKGSTTSDWRCNFFIWSSDWNS
ncbi:ap endonuclease, partial [Peziza echinospora]